MAPPAGGLKSRFKVVKAVGKGSFGAVSEIQRLSDGQLFALKVITKRTWSCFACFKNINAVIFK
eukprot:511126-Pelagomonas_calceolata.AAC.1